MLSSLEINYLRLSISMTLPLIGVSLDLSETPFEMFPTLGGHSFGLQLTNSRTNICLNVPDNVELISHPSCSLNVTGVALPQVQVKTGKYSKLRQPKFICQLTYTRHNIASTQVQAGEEVMCLVLLYAIGILILLQCILKTVCAKGCLYDPSISTLQGLSGRNQ